MSTTVLDRLSSLGVRTTILAAVRGVQLVEDRTTTELRGAVVRSAV